MGFGNTHWDYGILNLLKLRVIMINMVRERDFGHHVRRS